MSIATLLSQNKNDVYAKTIHADNIILNSIPMVFYSQSLPVLYLFQSDPLLNLNITVNAYFYRFGSLATIYFDSFIIPTGTMSTLSPLDLYGLDPIARPQNICHIPSIYVKIDVINNRLPYDHQIYNGSAMRLRNMPTENFDNSANDLIFLAHTISYII